MSDPALAWIASAVIVLWSWFWYYMGTKAYDHTEWDRGFREGKREVTTDAYRRGLEAGLGAKAGSLEGKVVDPHNSYPTSE